MVLSVDVIGACRLCFAPPFRFWVHNNMLWSDTSAQRSLRTSPVRVPVCSSVLSRFFCHGSATASTLLTSSGVGTCLMYSSSAKGAMPRQGLRGTVSLCQFHRAFKVQRLRLADLLPRSALLSNRNLRAMAVVMSSMPMSPWRKAANSRRCLCLSLKVLEAITSQGYLWLRGFIKLSRI